MIDYTTMVIFISDVHLGDIYCRIKEFENFLDNLIREVRNKKFPFLGKLIILGDFLDLLTSSYSALSGNNNMRRILDLLDILNTHMDVIIALGNHEISTINYDTNFSEYKRDFIEGFREAGLNYNFLEEENLCQYIVIGKNVRNDIVLSLFDSKKDIEFNQNNQIINNNPYNELFLYYDNPENNNCYFLTHGYQIESTTLRNIWARVWNICSRLDENAKKQINIRWHDLRDNPEGGDIENMQGERPFNRALREITDYLITLQKNIQSQLFNERIRDMMQVEPLSPITNVIYGHTHIEQGPNSDDDLQILNAGCWLDYGRPCYIEIDVDGNPIIKWINQI